MRKAGLVLTILTFAIAGIIVLQNVFSASTSTSLLYILTYPTPRRPILNSPAPNATTSRTTGVFEMTATHPTGNYLQYKQEIYLNEACTQVAQTNSQTSTPSAWTGQNASSGAAYASGQTGIFTLQSSLTSGTTYYWGASAMDPAGSGSFGSSSLTIKDPTWATSTALPFTDYYHSSFAYNGYAYVVGGCTDDACIYPTSTVLKGPISSTGSISYWTSTTALPFTESSHPSFAYNGYAYVVGGNANGAATSTVVFGPISSTGSIAYWTSTTQLPFTDSSHPSFAYNGYAYVVGGIANYAYTSTVVFGPISSTGSISYWTSTTALPFTESEHSSFAYNGYAYVVGGMPTAQPPPLWSLAQYPQQAALLTGQAQLACRSRNTIILLLPTTAMPMWWEGMPTTQSPPPWSLARYPPQAALPIGHQQLPCRSRITSILPLPTTAMRMWWEGMPTAQTPPRWSLAPYPPPAASPIGQAPLACRSRIPVILPLPTTAMPMWWEGMPTTQAPPQ